MDDRRTDGQTDGRTDPDDRNTLRLNWPRGKNYLPKNPHFIDEADHTVNCYVNSGFQPHITSSMQMKPPRSDTLSKLLAEWFSANSSRYNSIVYHGNPHIYLTCTNSYMDSTLD